jgi:hypothetical protein
MKRLHPGAVVNHIMGTRLLPSSNDSDNIFSGTQLLWNPWRRRTEIMTNQETLGLFNYALICVFVAKARVCTLKIAKEGLSAYSASYHGMSQAM